MKALEEIKVVIQHSYPRNMIYKRGAKMRVRTGKFRRRLAKTVATSEDKSFSVEYIGPPKKLKWVQFMVDLRNKGAAAFALVAIETCLRHIHPEWDKIQELRDWLEAASSQRETKETLMDGVKLTYMVLENLPLLFVKV